MGLKNGFNPFRFFYRPGLNNIQFYGGSTDLLPKNVIPACDLYGAQWVRDSSDPLVYGTSDPNAYRTITVAVPTCLLHGIGVNVASVELPPAPSNEGVALYSVNVFAGDPETDWSSDPIYFQMFDREISPIAPGAIPDFSLPVPRPPQILSFMPGVKMPFNGVRQQNESGVQMSFSSTANTYTPGPVGTINYHWARYRVRDTSPPP